MAKRESEFDTTRLAKKMIARMVFNLIHKACE